MSEKEEVVEIMRAAIREEYLRQHRDNDRAKVPGAIAYYEDVIGPDYQIRAALAAARRPRATGSQERTTMSENNTVRFLRVEMDLYRDDLEQAKGKERGRILGMISCLERAIEEIERLTRRHGVVHEREGFVAREES